LLLGALEGSQWICKSLDLTTGHLLQNPFEDQQIGSVIFDDK
jgi:hypothetical protein